MIGYYRKLIEDYVNWLKEKIKVEEVNGFYEIVTPFLDRHNDHIRIFVKRDNDKLILTDDGYTINDLILSGWEFTSEKRVQILNSILNSFGIKYRGNELFVEARDSDFPRKKHNLIQAILSVNDLFLSSPVMVRSFFREDVEKFLRKNNIRFTPRVSFQGKSGLVHFFDFVIPESEEKPERILKTINNPDKQKIISFIFSWTETKEIRPKNSTMYGVLNDVGGPIRPDLIEALDKYDIKPVVWSKKEEFIPELMN